jgi:excisionase family DNA binding protein
VSSGAEVSAWAVGAGTGGNGLVDIEAVASHLGVQVRHVRRLVAERRIPYVKWGHLLRFDPTEIDRWIEAAKVPAVNEPL